MDSFQEISHPFPSDVPKNGGGFGQSTAPFPTNGTRPNFNPGSFGNNFDDTNEAPVLLGVGGSLLFLSICLLAARLWSRLRPVYRLKLDDFTVLGATILALIQYLLIAFAVLNGLGRRAAFVPAPQRSTALRLLFISQLFFYYSITLAKLSVALLLLRFKRTLPWRLFLHATMAVALAAVLVQTCFQFLQCRPFSVYWDPRVFKLAQCFRRSIINGNIIVFSSIQVGIDLIFSVVPITFVRKLRRPRREKVFMCVLMGLGVFASCAAVVRTLTLQDYYTSQDVFRTNVAISLWAVVEQQMALMAATMPTLKAFMERSLVRVGLWCYDEGSEVRVRAELVRMGLLDEKDTLRSEESGVGAGLAGARGVVGAGEGGAGRDKDGMGRGDEQELTFREMLGSLEKGKECV